MSCGDSAPSVHFSPAFQGALAPEALRITLGPSDVLPDLTVVTGTTLTVIRPDQIETTWTLVAFTQTRTRLVLDHQWLAGDLDLEGTYQLLLTLTTPAGPVRCVPMCLPVVPWRCSA